MLCDWLEVDIERRRATERDVQPAGHRAQSHAGKRTAQRPAAAADRVSHAQPLVGSGHPRGVQLPEDRSRAEDACGWRSLGLVELLPSGRIKIRAARNFSWRKDGPIQKFFAAARAARVLATRFEAAGRTDALRRRHDVARLGLNRMHEPWPGWRAQLDGLVKQDLGLPVAERYGVSPVHGPAALGVLGVHQSCAASPRAKFF